MGARLMVETLASLDTITPQVQDSALATYAAKIDKAEARIDWSRSAEQIERQVRAFSPFPGAWFEMAGERVKLLRAEVAAGDHTPGTVLDDRFTVACGSGAIRPVQLQRAGKPAMALDDYLRGRPVRAGEVLA